MKELSVTPIILEEYLKMWFTEAQAEWAGYKNCLTKWRTLQETAKSADLHMENCRKWVSRLMAYEEWADTHTQPSAYEKVDLEIEECSYVDTVEWLMQRMYTFQSAVAYVDFYWTGVQRREYDC